MNAFLKTVEKPGFCHAIGDSRYRLQGEGITIISTYISKLITVLLDVLPEQEWEMSYISIKRLREFLKSIPSEFWKVGELQTVLEKGAFLFCSLPSAAID